MSRLRPASLLLVALAGCAPRGTAGPATPTGSPRTASLLPQLRAEAAALAPFVTSAEARRFLDATAALPAIPPRGALYQQKGTRNVITPAEHAALPAAQGATYTRLDLDETLYYSAKYGTPLAYARPLDLVAGADGDALRGRRIIDFGYGLIGHLRLLASLGNEVTGIDVDPLLPRLYGLPGDTGPIAGFDRRPSGSIRLLHGRFPDDPAIRDAVGGGYDLFISKNTLKRGYVHPSQPVDPRRTLGLTVTDETFVAAIHALLKPGGRALLYNLYPAPAPPGQPFIPWAEGETPFARAIWEGAGFRVIEFDRDDTAAARRQARLLGWDREQPPMDVDRDLFAIYTLVEKPR